MIKINKNYIDKFKYFQRDYHYMVKNGIWLTFDGETHEYIGNNYFYFPYNYKEIEKECDDKINDLIFKGILEVID